MKKALLSVIAVICVFAVEGRASTVTINLGSQNTTPLPPCVQSNQSATSTCSNPDKLIALGQFKSYSFSDLNGTPLAGQTISFNFVFDFQRWCCEGISDFSIYLGTNFPGNPGAPSGSAFGFGGEQNDGTAIRGGSLNRILFSSRPNGALVGYMMYVDQTNFLYGIHVDMTLPNDPGYEITSGALIQTRTDVPEVPAFPLILIGVGGVLWIARGRRQKVAVGTHPQGA